MNSQTDDAYLFYRERAGIDPEQEHIIVPLDELVRFLGEKNLPPYFDAEGQIIKESLQLDCSEITDDILEWLRTHVVNLNGYSVHLYL